MPVLVNASTGAAENLSPEAAQAAVGNNTHFVPLYSPSGEPITAPHAEASQLLSEGYSQPTTEELQGLLDYTKYGTPAEQAKTALEGAASGATFGLSTAAERAMGVKPEAIRLRREVNPMTHTAGEITGLVGTSLIGVGEGAALAKLGAMTAERLAPIVGTKALARIGTAAAQGAVENAIFQGGDEVSKWISEDPNQSAETAIANVGISGLLGATIGGGLGAVKPAWESLMGSKAGQFVEDFKGRIKEHLNNPDPVTNVRTELQDYYTGMRSMADEVYGTKGLKAQEIEKVMPSMAPKITEHATTLASDLRKSIEEMSTKPELYPQRLVAKLQNDVSSLEAKLGSQNPAELFNAVQDTKQMLQSYSKFDKFVKPVDEAYDFVSKSKELASKFRAALEDTTIWGKAAQRQNAINKAFVEFKPALEDFERKFTTDLQGERVIDPAKINTYINQLGKPNAEIKQSMLRNFMEASEKYKNVIDATHANLGIESPIIPSALTSVKGTLKDITAGAKVADVLVKDGLHKLLAGTTGAITGATTGHTVLGAILGEHVLSPFFKKMLPALTRPLLENPASGSGFKSAVSLVLAAAKGEAALTKAAGSVFGESNVIPMPKAKDLDKLKKRIDQVAENSDELMNIGGHTGHYLPDHATAIAATSARVVQYLTKMRPDDSPLGPLDKERKISKTEQANYDNALKIAENPLSIFQSIRDGTLTMQELQHLDAMYPALHARMQAKLTDNMVRAISKGETIPYKTKLSLSLFMQQPLDSSMAPLSIISNQPQIPIMPQSQPQNPRTRSNPQLSKLPAAEASTLQARQAQRTKPH